MFEKVLSTKSMFKESILLSCDKKTCVYVCALQGH